jgi:hypothetical protein
MLPPGGLIIRDFYGKGGTFSASKYGEISIKIMKKGLILAITPVKSIKKVRFKRG